MAARLGLSSFVVGASGSVPDHGGWLPSGLLTLEDRVPGCLSPRGVGGGGAQCPWLGLQGDSPSRADGRKETLMTRQNKNNNNKMLFIKAAVSATCFYCSSG